MALSVTSIRRYPVKAMGGEYLDEATLDTRGIVGDRWFSVVDADGKLATGKNGSRFRRRDEIFEYAAATTSDGVSVSHPSHGDWFVGAAALDQHLSSHLAAPVRVLPERDVMHHDAAPVSLVGTATLRWCADRWGIDADPRRLRVNLVVETDEPFVEEGWLGQTLALGSTRLQFTKRNERCRMIDLDQDGARAEGRWLKLLGDERDLSVCVYAAVAQPGTLRVGDELEGLDP